MESGKNRRSSILKPQKARNPLSDLDFTEAVEDISMVITGRPSMRRVSFASSNFVKEFATDPEKNTIWDSTYEETVNSDSTQSSENAHNTLGMQHTQCSDSAQITNENIHCVTMSNNGDPKLISTSHQLNQVYGLCTEETAEKTQKTVTKERTSTTTAKSIQQLHPRKVSINFNDEGGEHIKTNSSLFDIGRSRNLLEKENMQLTIGKSVTKILPKDKDVSLGATRKEKSDVSFTHTNKDVTGAFSSDKENQLYNMTPQFSGVKRSNLSTEVDRSLNKENINILSNDIRFISNKRNFQIANDNMKVMPSVSLTTSKNMNVTDDTSMEFTQHITRSNNGSYKVYGNRTVMSDISMEVTRHLVSRLVTNTEVVENRTITSEDDMEFTQQITDINIEDFEKVQNTPAATDDNMEFTRHISSLNKTIRDETIMSEENMECTRAVGVINKADCTQNKTVTSDDEVEVDENVAILNKEKPERSSSKTVKDIINMEFIQELPIVNKPNFESTINKTTLQDENMELTQQDVFSRRDSTIVQNKFEISGMNKEPSETSLKISSGEGVVNKPNFESARNKTTIQDENMELTQQDVFTRRDSKIVQNKFEISGMNMETYETYLKITNCEGTSNKTISQDENELAEQKNSYSKTNSILVANESKSSDPNREFITISSVLHTSSAEVMKNENVSVKSNDLKLISQPIPEIIFKNAKNTTVDVTYNNLEYIHQPTSLQGSFRNTADKDQISDYNMELTGVIFDLSQSNNKGTQNETIDEKDSKNEAINVKDGNEFTLQLLPLKTSFRISMDKQQGSDVNMQFSEVISALNKSHCEGTKNETIDVKDDMKFLPGSTPLPRNFRNSADKQQNMDFTEVIFDLNKSNYEGTKNDTTDMKDDMFTPQSTPLQIIIRNSVDKQQTSDINMEFTEVISALNKSNYEGTMHDSIDMKDDIFTSQPTPAKKSFQNSADNQPSINANMEFTEVVSALNKSNYENTKNDTIDMKDGMEFTLQPTSLLRSFRNSTDKQHISDINTEFTEIISALNKSNYEGINNDTIGMKDGMEFTSQPTHLQRSLINSADKQQISDINMEFTEVISTLNKSNYEGAKNDSIDMKDDMEFTPQLTPLQRCLTNSADKQQISDNMEFTEVMSALNKSNYEGTKSDTIGMKDDMEFTPQPTPLQRSLTNSADTQQLSDNMEFTEVISALNKSNYEGTNNDTIGMKDDMEFTPQPTPLQRSLTNSADKQQISDNMEFTEVISALNKSNYEGAKNDTIGMKDDMEFTPQPTPLQRSLTNSADKQQISENIELTEVISALNKSNYEGAKNDTIDLKDDMEFTRQPTPLQKSFRNSVDKPQISDINMEFTEVISALNKSNYGGTKNDTIDINDDMEFTPQPTHLQRSLKNSADKQQISDINMEFTEVISALNKSNYEGAKNDSIDMKDDMKFTSQPTPLQRSFRNSADKKQQISDINMEFAEVISALNKSNYGGTKNDSIDMKDDMEFSPQLTPLQGSFTNSEDKQKISDVSMEFAEVISALNKSNYESKKIEIIDVKENHMEFSFRPTTLQTNFRNSVDNEQISNVNMEFMKVTSALSKSNLEGTKDDDTINGRNDNRVFAIQSTSLQTSSRNSEDKQLINNVNMKFAEIISPINKSNSENIRNETMKDDIVEVNSQPSLLNKTSSKNVEGKLQRSDGNVKFAEVVFDLNKSNVQSSKAVVRDNNMEFAPQLTPVDTDICRNKAFTESLILSLSKADFRQTNISVTKSDNTEFTSHQSSLNTPISENINKLAMSNTHTEFIQLQSTLNKTVPERTGKETISKGNDMNKTNSKNIENILQVRDTELVPAPNKVISDNERNKSGVKDDTIQFTQKPSSKADYKNITNEFQSGLDKSHLKNETSVEDIQRDEADNMRFSLELTSANTKICRNKKKKFKMDSTDTEFTERVPSLSKVDFSLIRNESIMKSDNTEFTSRHSRLNKMSSENIKNAMDNTSTECIQLSSTLNRSVLGGLRNKIVSKEDDMVFIAQTMLNSTNSQNIENKVQVSDTQLVCAPNKTTVSDSEKNKASVKDDGIKFTPKPSNKDYKNTTNTFQMSNANMEFTSLESGLNISNLKVTNRKTIVKDVQRNETVTKDINIEFIPQLTPMDKKSSRNMEFTEPVLSLSKADFGLRGNESIMKSDNAEFISHPSPLKKISSENIKSLKITTSEEIEPFNKRTENIKMGTTTEEYIQLPSTLNKSVFDGARKETISKEDDMIFIAQPTLDSQNIENKLQVGDAELVLAPISDSERIKTSVKDESIEITSKSSKTYRNNANLGFTDLEFNLNKPYPKNKTIVKDTKEEVFQYLYPLKKLSSNNIPDENDMKFIESPCASLNKVCYEVVQNTTECELQKNSSKINCKNMENLGNTTTTNMELNHEEAASKDINNFFGINYANIDKDNERFSCYETSMKAINKNKNFEFIQPSSSENYAKADIHSDNPNMEISVHSPKAEPVAADFHKSVFPEHLHNLIESNKYNVVARQIENHSLEFANKVSSNESFAMDVDTTPVKDTSRIKFSYSQIVNTHNINVTVRADKKKSIQSGVQSKIADICLESNLLTTNNDCMNKMDPQLRENSHLQELANSSFNKNISVNLFENSIQKLDEDNCASITKSDKQENTQLSESSKHFDASIVCNEDGQITNSTSVEQALTGLRYLDAQTVSTRANTVPHSICEFKTPGSSFHTSYIDDTQHLINYSLSNRQPKSDFSKIITGDLNPTFLSSKFMHLSDFSSCAFPISLDNTRNNQTHLDCTQNDKDKSCKDYYEDKPQQISYSVENKTVTLHSDTLPVLQETSRGNQTDPNDVEVPKNMNCKNLENKPHQTTYVITSRNDKTYTLEDTISQKLDKEVAKDENCKELNDNQVTYLINDKDNTSVKVEEIIKPQKRRSSENIEAAVECKKMLLDTTENLNLVSEALEMETSFNDQIKMEQNSECSKGETLNISQENLTLSDSIDDSFLPISVAAQQVIGNITRSFNSPSIDCTDLASEITENRFSSRSKALWEAYLESNSIRSTIEEFMVKTRSQLATMSKNSAIIEEKCGEAMKKLHVPFKRLSFLDAQGSIGSSMEYSSNEPTMSDMVQEENPLSEVDMEIEKVLTLEEEIEKKCRRSKRYWSIFAKEENKYEFYTLYKTIRLVVYFNMEVGIVNATDVYSHISDESDAVALFVHNIFKERLSQKNIKSAVGDRYDILTLLDYVYMNMQKMIDILNEFDRCKKSYAMKMDRDFRVTFTIINTYLVNTWCISVDLADIDNITEDSVSAWAKVGIVKEAEIKNLVKSCPRGVVFLQNFIKNILVYVDILKKRKVLLKMKVGNIG